MNQERDRILAEAAEDRARMEEDREARIKALEGEGEAVRAELRG